MADKAPIKRKKKAEEKPLCKYGKSCYQKNSDHLQRFRHPSPERSMKEEEQKNIEVKENSPPKRKKTLNQKAISPPTDLNAIMKKSFLVEMPQDFYDFWEFCCAIDRNNPQDILSDLGLHLVGPFDVLSGKLSGEEETNKLLCHWRYYYDPPEFQTVVKKDGEDLYHIGYFRDDPKEMPSVVASNSAAIGAKLKTMGDNIFAAMNLELKGAVEKAKKPAKEKFENIHKDMQEFAKSKKYSLDTKSTKIKARDKKVVAKTFHGLGIVVPIDKKNDVGYRPLPESDATLKLILKKISQAKTKEDRLKAHDDLQEIITNVQFANDECDYGMGLELGIDIFCFGDTCFNNEILFLLPVAYELLQRPQFVQVIQAHVENRRKGDDLSAES